MSADPTDSTDSTDPIDLTDTTDPPETARTATDSPSGSGRLPTSLPDDEDPVRCRYCGRPFPSERLRDLHLGERHADLLTAEEAAAYESAEEAEVDDLFVYHLKVVALLVVVVMGLSYVYAFVLA